jgi:hypothetical protein
MALNDDFDPSATIVIDNDNFDVGYSGDENLKSKFTQNEWLAAEQPVTAFVKTVIDVLKSFAKGQDYDRQIKYATMGEENYLAIRHDLEKWPLVAKLEVKEKSKATNKSVKLKKADEIIRQNTLRLLTNDCSTLLKSFQKQSMTYELGLKSSKYLEFRGITLMYCAWFIISKPETYKREKYREDVYELIVAISKFVESKNELDISLTMISDLMVWKNKLCDFCPFDGLLLNKFAPRLLIYTKYDDAIPTIRVKPRKHQMELINTVKQNLTMGLLISYIAMTGDGKTTAAAVCLSSLIEKINLEARATGSETRYELIFCCNVDAVRSDVARVAFNGQIPFAIASMTKNGAVRVINHNNTKDEDRVLIIADPETARELLKTEEKNSKLYDTPNKYWFFLDEPTIGASYLQSTTLKENMSILPYMPRYSFFSSATMCSLSRISSIVEYQKKKFPGIYVGSVYSNEIQIGCNVKSLTGERIIPHMGCQSQDQLKTTIQTIQTSPFLGRMYTSDVALMLHEKMTELNIKNLPDIKTQFSNVSNLKFDNVRSLCIDLLTTLSNEPNEVIEQICQTTIKMEKKQKPKTKTDDDIIFEDEMSDDEQASVDYSKLGTTDAHKYLQMNLIVTKDPLSFSENNFKSLLDRFEQSRITVSALHRNYEAAVKKFNERYERLDKRVKNEEDRNKEQQEMLDERSPLIQFPDVFQINTIEHIKEYAKGNIKSLNASMVRARLNLESINYDNLMVPDWVLLLLYAGVGVYCPSNRLLSNEYHSTVLLLASNGQLAYLVADGSISYGTNYPFARVFPTSDYANSCSINEVFQILGRPGRVGQSWSAEAYLEDDVTEKILEYVKDTENSPSAMIEPVNMETVFKSFIDEINNIDLMKRRLIQEKKLQEHKRKQHEQEKEEQLKKEKEEKHIMTLAEVKQKYSQTEEKTKGSEADTWRRGLPSNDNTINKTSEKPESKSFTRPMRQDTTRQDTTRQDTTRQETNRQERREPIRREQEKEPVKPKYVPPHLRKTE